MKSEQRAVSPEVEIRITDGDFYEFKRFGEDGALTQGHRSKPPTFVPAFLSDDLGIDFERRKIFASGRRVRLTPNEFYLLRLLVAEQGQPVSHRRLLLEIWGSEGTDKMKCLRVLVSALRKKIEPAADNPKYIHTDSRIGYRFELDRFTRKEKRVPDRT